MDEKKSENINKTPEKMSRIAWPKAKYGLVVAIIIIVVVNLIYYKDKIINLSLINISEPTRQEAI